MPAPVSSEDPAEHASEYAAVRTGAGLWIRKDAALISITGADRYTWLQGMISNDTTLLSSGSLTRLPACILDATGHIISVITLTVRPDEPDSLLMETPSSERDRLLDLLDRYLITEDVELSRSNLGTVTLQGPGVGLIALDICDQFRAAYYAADHTGSGGFDVYLPPDTIDAFVHDCILRGAASVPKDVIELLRIEAGIPKYGVDMDATVIALEAGLGSSHISLTKGCYVGQEIIARIDSRGHTNRALTGLVFAAGTAPAPGDTIFSEPNSEAASPRETGRVTSAAPASPAMDGRPIALGYVRHEHRTPGATLRVGVDAYLAEVVELPFWTG